MESELRALIDTNVLIDLLAAREPFAAEAAAVWTSVENRRITGLVSADEVTTVFYVLQRIRDMTFARRGVQMVIKLFEIVPVDRDTLVQAAESPIADFEDAVQYYAALAAGADCIVTRDAKGFKQADLRVLSPARLLDQIDP